MLQKLLAPFLALAHLLFPSPATQYAKMIDRVESSIVRVHGMTPAEIFGETVMAPFTCTGEVVAQDRVLTAAHCVVEGTQELKVDLADAKVIAADDYYDLALLAVPTGHEPILPIRDEPVTRYEALTAIGYANGWARLTVIPVSAFLLNVSLWSEDDKRPVAPGNMYQPGFVRGMSGGPVVDADGFLVGVAQQGTPGMGYGVGTLLIRAFLLAANAAGDLPTN